MRIALGTVLLVSLFAPTAFAETPVPELLRLRAAAVNKANKARSGTVELVVERWSTPAEAQVISAILIEKRSEKLLPAIRGMKPRCGFVRDGQGRSFDIYYARLMPTEDAGRRIVLVTDRPVGLWGTKEAPLLNEYEFTLAEIHLGPDGKGEGRAIPAAKLWIDQQTGLFAIENFDKEPVRLDEVHTVAPERR